MLELKEIRKVYRTGSEELEALKGISLSFKPGEFVAILGQSGCGKTTLLNIVGGLDRYTSGDLVINGVSTKDYKSGDWDTYRNHSIGFVFQSYQLIPHQTVLANVELTMTLSGVPKKERKQRAIEALQKVGIERYKKKPNQMSGGQAQRVAIARALVNNPEIILADEPTGALDSETSLQIMELLKEVAKEHLVIMVTHNPELAQAYATRIVRLSDGKVISDEEVPENKHKPMVSVIGEETKQPVKKTKKEKKKSRMSFFTALSLSLNNLMTKKGRTFLTAFAGAIGIIGIALILAASTGVQKYIDDLEADTLSSYPLMVQRNTTDFTEMMESMMTKMENQEDVDVITKVHSNNMMTNIITSLVNNRTENDMVKFKKFLETDEELQKYVRAIEYGYSTQLNVYTLSGVNASGFQQVNPATVMDAMGTGMQSNQATSGLLSAAYDVWKEMPVNEELTGTMYEVIDGRLPEKYNEIVVAVTERGELSDYTLYALGLLDQEELKSLVRDAMMGKELTAGEERDYTFEELKNMEFTVLPNTSYFEKQEDGTYKDKREDETFLRNALKEDGIPLSIVGVVRINQGGTNDIAIYGGILYSKGLKDHLIRLINESEIVKEQKEHADTDIFTNILFEPEEKEPMTYEGVQAYIQTLPDQEKSVAMAMLMGMKQQGMTEEQIAQQFDSYLNKTTDATYKGNLQLLGVADLEDPSRISIYPKDFEAKEEVVRILDEYASSLEEGEELKYTDYVGLIMSSVTTIINVITYVLIGFVAVSLIVSSIMIGIITYISVLERTREIGILRSIGASRRDISGVFNAETLIVGFISGIIGVVIPYLISSLVNQIIFRAFGIENIMYLAPEAAVILVFISMLLTLIGGLIPSRIAAKKDPVEALRTE